MNILKIFNLIKGKNIYSEKLVPGTGNLTRKINQKLIHLTGMCTKRIAHLIDVHIVLSVIKIFSVELQKCKHTKHYSPIFHKNKNQNQTLFSNKIKPNCN